MKIFLRLLRFLFPFRWHVTLAILLGCVMIASNIGLLGMAAYLIAAAALGPLIVMLTLPTYIVRLMGVTRAVSRYGERLQTHNVTFHLLARLRTWVYRRLEPLAPAHLLTYRSGDLLTRLVADVEELQNIYLRVVSPIITAVIICLLTFGLFSIFSTMLAWVALTFLVITGFGVPLLAGALASGLGKRQLGLRAELKVQMVDGIQGIQDLLAYGRAGDQRQKIVALDNELKRVQQRLAHISGLQQALNDALMNLALWAILILAIPLVTTRFINGVYLGFLTLVILASFEAVQPLAQTFQFLGHSLAAGERLFRITDATPTVIESASPVSVPRWNGHYARRGGGGVDAGRDTCPPDGVPLWSHALHESVDCTNLEFDQVSFAYTPIESEVLHEISFEVCPGKRVAIVGPSGSGKSTLMRLALRLWDPTKGMIRLNGQNISMLALDALRDRIGVVAQDTYLFNDTIRGNLLLARPGASDDELAQVLDQAQLSEFVQQLPMGLETWIGEQGLRLSGGERQRLAIARALLKDAPILILDEITANLDPLTEGALLDSLDGLMQGRTTLMMTHRLIAMERVDEILVLDHGQIRERGTHEQLLASGRLYRQMYDIQAGNPVWGAGNQGGAAPWRWECGGVPQTSSFPPEFDITL
ncbi:MAG TPA: thiol reductant ABC exporter subunit CydC [Ktedonobacteraceae bacterium]|nr:thiol reductant ABC exporter subunit CydC [Ktedonobacteraceae bacterium]